MQQSKLGILVHQNTHILCFG